MWLVCYSTWQYLERWQQCSAFTHGLLNAIQTIIFLIFLIASVCKLVQYLFIQGFFILKDVSSSQVRPINVGIGSTHG